MSPRGGPLWSPLSALGASPMAKGEDLRGLQTWAASRTPFPWAGELAGAPGPTCRAGATPACPKAARGACCARRASAALLAPRRRLGHFLARWRGGTRGGGATGRGLGPPRQRHLPEPRRRCPRRPARPARRFLAWGRAERPRHCFHRPCPLLTRLSHGLSGTTPAPRYWGGPAPQPA